MARKVRLDEIKDILCEGGFRMLLGMFGDEIEATRENVEAARKEIARLYELHSRPGLFGEDEEAPEFFGIEGWNQRTIDDPETTARFHLLHFAYSLLGGGTDFLPHDEVRSLSDETAVSRVLEALSAAAGLEEGGRS